MIFFECPYCSASDSTQIASECPKFERKRCDSCAKEFWVHHSRIPGAGTWTTEGLMGYCDIDFENKTVKLKDGVSESELFRL